MATLSTKTIDKHEMAINDYVADIVERARVLDDVPLTKYATALKRELDSLFETIKLSYQESKLESKLEPTNTEPQQPANSLPEESPKAFVPKQTGQDVPAKKKSPANTPFSELTRRSDKAQDHDAIMTFVKEQPDCAHLLQDAEQAFTNLPKSKTAKPNAETKPTPSALVAKHKQQRKGNVKPPEKWCCGHKCLVFTTLESFIAFLQRNAEPTVIENNVAYYYCEQCGETYVEAFDGSSEQATNQSTEQATHKCSDMAAHPGSTISANYILNSIVGLANNIPFERSVKSLNQFLRTGNNYLWENARIFTMAHLIPLFLLIRYAAAMLQVCILVDETTMICLFRSGQNVACFNPRYKDERTTTIQYFICIETPPNGELKFTLYCYAMNRHSDALAEVISQFPNVEWLLTDHYAGYNKVVEAKQLKHGLCLAHVRRKLVNAISPSVLAKEINHAITEGKPVDTLVAYAAKAYALLEQVFAYEPSRDSSLEQVAACRKITKPILEQFFQVLHEAADAPNSGIQQYSGDNGKLKYRVKDKTVHSWFKAVVYVLNAEDGVKLAHSNPIMPIDNNSTESSIRNLAMLRNVSNFRTSEFGMDMVAVIMSIVKTFQKNNLGNDALVDITNKIGLELRRVYFKNAIADDKINPYGSNVNFTISSEDYIRTLPQVPVSFWEDIINSVLHVNPERCNASRITIGEDFKDILAEAVEGYYQAYPSRRKQD